MNAPVKGDAAPPGRVFKPSLPFSVERVSAHLERLTGPRRVGTPEERRAARYILGQFALLGLRRRRERFSVAVTAREIGLRVVYLASALAVWQGGRVAFRRPLVAALCFGAVALLVNASWTFAGRLAGWWMSTRTTSENLVASLPVEDEDLSPARVVFMAHYDTKSQLLPTGLRVGAVVGITAACSVLAVLSLIKVAAVRGQVPAMLSPMLSAVVLVLLGLLAVNLTGNRSPGALDNASGVGTLLELARTWRPRSEAPVEVLWVATGSEETGLDGARDFLARHESWWREMPTLLINLDSVGAGRQVFLAGAPEALRLAEQTADQRGIPRARLRVIGAGMDHEPFAARGLDAVSLLGDVVGKSLVMHSSRDRLGVVEVPALARAGDLAAHLAWAWADRHRPQFWNTDDSGRSGSLSTALASEPV